MVVHTGAGALQPFKTVFHHALGFVQIDPVAVDLQEAFLPAHNIIEAIRIPLCHIAGDQPSVPLVPFDQILLGLRVAQRHVGPFIYQLTHHFRLLDLLAVHVNEAEPAAGDGNAHAAVLFQRAFCRQVSHPGCSLGLAVHNDELLALFLGIFRKLPVQLRQKLAARLGHGAQRRQLHAEETEFFQHFICIGHAAKGSGPCLLEEIPEFFFPQGVIGQQHFCAHQHMAVDDGQAIGVVHPQGGDGALRLVQLQILCNGSCVGLHILIALAHQLGASCAARSGQQQCQIVIQRHILRVPGPVQAIAHAAEHAGVPSKFLCPAHRRIHIGRTVRFHKLLRQILMDVVVQQQRHDPVFQKT